MKTCRKYGCWLALLWMSALPGGAQADGAANEEPGIYLGHARAGGPPVEVVLDVVIPPEADLSRFLQSADVQLVEKIRILSQRAAGKFDTIEAIVEKTGIPTKILSWQWLEGIPVTLRLYFTVSGGAAGMVRMDFIQYFGKHYALRDIYFAETEDDVMQNFPPYWYDAEKHHLGDREYLRRRNEASGITIEIR